MNSPIEPPRRIRSRTEAHVLVRMDTLFASCPQLIGFFLQDRAEFKDVLNPRPQGDLCVSDMGFSVPVSEALHETLRELIRAMVQQILVERPEAFEVMRERTFARVMH